MRKRRGIPIREDDLQILRGLESAREQHGALADLLDFYHDLYELQFQVKAALPDPKVPDDLAIHWRLEQGISQLTFDQLGIDPEPFAQTVALVTGVLLRHNPTWPAECEDRTPAELVVLACQVFETWDTLTSPGPQVQPEAGGEAWLDFPIPLAVGLALAPYLQRAAEVVLPRLDLALWVRGTCPVCGGRPNLALLERTSGARRLLCSRCNALWDYPRIGCPSCGSREKQTYYPSQDGAHRLYVCPACHRYLKTVDLRELARPVLPPVERLLTVGMDLAAQQLGATCD